MCFHLVCNWVDGYRGQELIASLDPSGENASLDQLTITSKGFQFLLEDRQTQLWQILMYFLAFKEVSSALGPFMVIDG